MKDNKNKFYTISIYNPLVEKFIYYCENSILKYTLDEDKATKFNYDNVWNKAVDIYRNNKRIRKLIDITKWEIVNKDILFLDCQEVYKHVLNDIWCDIVGRKDPIFYL